MAWVFTYLVKEVKRQQLLLQNTREDYAKKSEVKSDIETVMDALHRLEDKLDKLISADLLTPPTTTMSASLQTIS